jgi:uncharacterized membrane protein YbhN (UPF0104 family)
MKILLFVLIILSIFLIGYNITQINLDHPFHGDSMIAVIGVLAALCAIILLLIFIQSRKINNKIKNKDNV